MNRLVSLMQTTLIPVIGLSIVACMSGDDLVPDEAVSEAAVVSFNESKVPQEVPTCQFTAPPEELTERPSPPDSASVNLGDAVAKICYGAPSMRGREIMGGLVPFGQPWRLGANEPTTLHVTAPVQVGRTLLEPGSYALYAVPGPETWEIFVNSVTERWGIPINEAVREKDLGSFTVTAQYLERPVERLSIDMESIDEHTARVAFKWENTLVEFGIRRVDSLAQGRPQVVRALNLLGTVPFVANGMDSSAFLAASNDLLVEREESVLGAVKALEDLLPATTVDAVVTSQPPGCRVSYRRITEPDNTSGEVTTDIEMTLIPAWYDFICDADTATTNCTLPCEVFFDRRR